MFSRFAVPFPLLALLAGCAAGADGSGARVDPGVQRLMQATPASFAGGPTAAEMSRTRGEGWLLVAGNPQLGVHYMHMPRLVRQGSLVTGWVLTNHWSGQRDSTGFPYLSSLVQMQFDCAGGRSRVAEVQFFSDRGAVGANRTYAGPPSDWRPVGARSVAEGMLVAACGLGGGAPPSFQDVAPPRMTVAPAIPDDPRGPAKSPR